MSGRLVGGAVAFCLLAAFPAFAAADRPSELSAGIGCIEMTKDGSSKVKEDIRNGETDSRVYVTSDGNVKVCNTPVPKDRNGRPMRKGEVTWCVSGPVGKEKCTTEVKDATALDSKIENVLARGKGYFIASQTERTLAQLQSAQEKNSSGSIGMYDPYGVIVPFSEEEKTLAEKQLGSKNGLDQRYVEVPVDQIDKIAQDVPGRIQQIAQEKDHLLDIFSRYGMTDSAVILNRNVVRASFYQMDDSGLGVMRLPSDGSTVRYGPFELPPGILSLEKGVVSDAGEVGSYTYRGQQTFNTPVYDAPPNEWGPVPDQMSDIGGKGWHFVLPPPPAPPSLPQQLLYDDYVPDNFPSAGSEHESSQGSVYLFGSDPQYMAEDGDDFSEYSHEQPTSLWGKLTQSTSGLWRKFLGSLGF